MTHQPLMLSDTAMVLLRQYLEVSETEALRLMYVKKLSQRASQKRTFITSPQLRLLAEEFMLELEALSLCPDLVPIRQLDQHFVLKDNLLDQLVWALTQLPEHRVSRSGINLRVAAFVAQVAQAYQTMLITHIQQPSLGKDQT